MGGRSRGMGGKRGGKGGGTGGGGEGAEAMVTLVRLVEAKLGAALGLVEGVLVRLHGTRHSGGTQQHQPHPGAPPLAPAPPVHPPPPGPDPSGVAYATPLPSVVLPELRVLLQEVLVLRRLEMALLLRRLPHLPTAPASPRAGEVVEGAGAVAAAAATALAAVVSTCEWPSAPWSSFPSSDRSQSPTFPPPRIRPRLFSLLIGHSRLLLVVPHDWTVRCPTCARPSSPFDDLRTVFLRSSPRRSPPQSILPSPPESSLTSSTSTPITDYYRATRPIVTRVLASLVTDPHASPSFVLALSATILDFAATRRLDYATHVVAARPLSAGGSFNGSGFGSPQHRPLLLPFTTDSPALFLTRPFESSGPYAELVGCVILGADTVSWSPTRSSSLDLTSAVAAIYTGAMAAQELRWFIFLLTDLGERSSSAPTLFADNKAMILMCREPQLESRVKHIDVSVHHAALPAVSHALCPARRAARLLPIARPARCPARALPCPALCLHAALPCSPRAALPCSLRTILPCSPRAALPCSPHRRRVPAALPCSPRAALPYCLTPCSPRFALRVQPCSPCAALPCSPRAALPCSPRAALPSCPHVLQPARCPALQPVHCPATTTITATATDAATAVASDALAPPLLTATACHGHYHGRSNVWQWTAAAAASAGDSIAAAASRQLREWVIQRGCPSGGGYGAGGTGQQRQSRRQETLSP
ncbi:unnamed protein product [Closterium sp. NIES-54]